MNKTEKITMEYDAWKIVDSKCKSWKPHQVFTGTLEDAIKFFTEMFGDQPFVITEKCNCTNILYFSEQKPKPKKPVQLQLF